jgi:hypothetical protein
VKRRAKEVLDIIHDAVKKGLSGAVEEPRGLLPTVSSEATGTFVPSRVDADATLTPTGLIPQLTSLWFQIKGLPIAATFSVCSIIPCLTDCETVGQRVCAS